MTSKQRAFLRGAAMNMAPLASIGKAGVTDGVIAEIDNLLENRELVKVSLLKNSDLDVKEVGNYVAKALRATLVQTVGSKLTLYRVSKRDDVYHIVLPD